jgi:hypothetical protein
MSRSLKTFRNEFTQGLLNFIWRQWQQMGVAGSVSGNVGWFIDLEPVLAFTTEIARHDARIFDEVLDWLTVNGQWVNTQRLATILDTDDVGSRPVIGAIASWLTEIDKSAKWRGLARKVEPESLEPPESLFYSQRNSSPTALVQRDRHFELYGLLRQPIDIRGMTQPVNMSSPTNAVFKCRAVFGIGIRADVILYLLATDGGHARGIASLLGYNHMRVRELLIGLAAAGVVKMRQAGRTKHYFIDREKWGSVLLGHLENPGWVDGRALFRGLTVLWREVWSIDEERADDYIFSSKMRTAIRSARDGLLASGTGIDIEDDRGHIAEDYLPVFLKDMAQMLETLNSQ